MVRPPKIRHSKERRDPVTIDLDPADVKRESGVAEPTAAAGSPAATGPSVATGSPGASVDAKSAASDTRTSPRDADAASSPVKPDPKPTPQEAAITRKASEAESSTAKVVASGPTPEAAAKSDAPKLSPAATSASAAASAAKPAFGRDASASADTSSGSARAAPPPVRSTGGPDTAPHGADKAGPTRGGVALVAAGIIGGFVVLAGASALQYAGVLPSPGSSSEQDEPAGLADLRAELATLRDEVAAGNSVQPDPAEAARLDTIDAAVEKLQTDVDGLRTAMSQGGGGEAAGLQAIDQRIADLETAVASLGGNAGASTPVDLAPLNERIGTVESQLAAVSRTAQAASEATAGIPDRLASLDQSLSAVDARVSELASRVDAQASNPRIALAIAAAGLKAAIDRGDPFMSELETYASIAPDAPEIADLRGLAASGVPTRAAISSEVNAAANRMIAAAAPPAADTGFFGRLLDSMQSVIKVRPIGDVEGDDVGAIVARMEAAVRAGDYGRGITEYETLPEAAKLAGAEFIARVRARQTADALVERALAEALRTQEG